MLLVMPAQHGDDWQPSAMIIYLSLATVHFSFGCFRAAASLNDTETSQLPADVKIR